MKITFGTLTISSVFFMIFTASCTRDAAVITIPTSSSVEQRAGTSTKFLNVLMYTRSAHEDHDAHSDAGHILEFHNSDCQSLEAVNAVKMQSALVHIKTAVLTGDTTGQYLNLFTYIIPNSAYMDTCLESALVHSPNFNAFEKNGFKPPALIG